MKTKLILFVLLTIIISCHKYPTSSISFYNYSHNNDLLVKVAVKNKEDDRFKDKSAMLVSRNDIKYPYKGTIIDNFDYDRFLISFLSADESKIYKQLTVSKRRLFKCWKGNIKYGKNTWRSFLSESDYKNRFPDKIE